ncbi:MAG: aminotransferase class I/II-fold pyridoxal phosphate-dependent enzyme [Microbacterium sp.]
MTVQPLEAEPLERLRARSNTKWATHPDDVLPLFVAETDFALAPAIKQALRAAVERDDTGYTPPRTAYPEAFAGFAERRWGWTLDPDKVRTTCDVMMGVVEAIRAVTQPGDGIIVTPPVYEPFFAVHRESKTVPVEVPLLRENPGWRLDLDGIERAFAGGARAILLCSPHNPTGTVHSREELARLASIAERHGGYVISDEVHAPMTLPGAVHVPLLDVSDEAREVGVIVTSSSKTFDLAGLKAAHFVTASERMAAIVRDIPWEVEWRTSLFGIIAGIAAFTDADGWLDALIARFDLNRRLFGDLLTQHVPGAEYEPPAASFLAWVDFRSLGWGDDPSVKLLEEARVAVTPGPVFGQEGHGWARVNFGTGPELLTEAIERIGGLLR